MLPHGNTKISVHVNIQRVTYIATTDKINHRRQEGVRGSTSWLPAVLHWHQNRVSEEHTRLVVLSRAAALYAGVVVLSSYGLFRCLSSRHAGGGAESFVARWTLLRTAVVRVSHVTVTCVRSRACVFFLDRCCCYVVAAGPEQSPSATAFLGRTHCARTRAATSPPRGRFALASSS